MGALPAGSTVRFRVRGGSERFGSSWSITSARHSGDVYLSHREGARWIKTSFHESGQWHYAVTEAGLSLDPDVPAYLGVVKEHCEIAPDWLHYADHPIRCPARSSVGGSRLNEVRIIQ